MTAPGGPAARTAESLSSQSNYRSDVDGLRGIAVLAVIAFHAFPGIVAGGFVGVDIFFVISGFLISSILFRNLEQNTFSYVEFYARRVRRIFPSLIVVLIPCLVFGWLLPPTDFRQIGKHVAAGAGFVSNFAFWKEAGYFDAAAESKPLLHLWSLGVEEQFYIFWPLLLAICSRRKLNLFYVTLIIAVASFAINLHLVRLSPAAAFYSPISRFWELMLGGLLAFLAIHRPNRLPWKAAWVPFAGMLFVALGILLINPDRLFPGWLALLPTAGASLLIAAGPDSWLNSKVLSNRALVTVGLISYPLYLWHWPVLYAARRLFLYRIGPGKAATGILLAAVALSILLSWLTYRLVETPIRFGKWKNKAVRPLAGTMLALLLAGLATFQTKGFAFRFSPEVMAILNTDFQSDAYKSYRYQTCFLTPQQRPSQFADCTSHPALPATDSILLWGDSHAAQFYPGLAKRTGPTTQLTQFTKGGCPPVINITVNKQPQCKEANKFVLDYIARTHPDRVILAAAWPEYDWTQNEDNVADTVSRLRELQIKHIELVGPVPSWASGLPVALFKYSRKHPVSAPLPHRMTFGGAGNIAEVDRSMETFAERRNIQYFSPYRILCNADGCLTMLGDSPTTLTAWDASHLTEAGSNYVVAHFGESFIH